MTVVWIVIAAAVVVAALLTVLEVRNRRRARSLAHLEPADPAEAARAVADADAGRDTAQGWSRAAHQGISGAGGMGPGA